MEIVPIRIENGEERAWQTLAGMSAAEVLKSACVTHEGSVYTVRCLGMGFTLDVEKREIGALTLRGRQMMLGKYRDFARLSLLWYLTSAKDIPFTGKLLRPVDVKGGQRFSQGTHRLPLDKIAARFASDREGFLGHGAAFGGVPVKHGDAALTLYPLPRVPVTFILWLEDEEFPARVDFFFDSTCDFQISLSDIVWSIAMMTCLVMLEDMGDWPE